MDRERERYAVVWRAVARGARRRRGQRQHRRLAEWDPLHLRDRRPYVGNREVPGTSRPASRVREEVWPGHRLLPAQVDRAVAGTRRSTRSASTCIDAKGRMRSREGPHARSTRSSYGEGRSASRSEEGGVLSRIPRAIPPGRRVSRAVHHRASSYLFEGAPPANATARRLAEVDGTVHYGGDRESLPEDVVTPDG